MIKSLLENSFYIAAIVLAFLLVAAIAPKGPYPPAGILLPAEKVFSNTTSDAIQLYDTKPIGAVTVGFVNIATHSKYANELRQQETLDYGLALAASVGANGLVLSGSNQGINRLFVYDGNENLPGFMRKYVLRGEAIYTSAR